MTDATSPVRKPARVQTASTALFWQHADEGELLLQRCGACRRYQFYPRPFCVHCWSTDLDWIPAGGAGTVWTFTVAHQPGHPAWSAEAPYVIAIVELDEGPRMLTNIVDCDPDGISVGDRVRLKTDAETPLSFVPASS